MVLEWEPDNYGPPMLAELRRLHSPDVDDLRNWVSNSAEFAILVQIIASPAGSSGEESFDVTVCSPAWLVGQLVRPEITEVIVQRS
jgi:hypothetical protein